MAEFVNPYTFVPHVADPVRGRPAGHEALGEGRFSGVLDIRLTARTPLLIGGFSTDENGQQGEPGPGVPRRADGTPIVPGSGVLGAVRSVHEALTGSCLRVLDTELVPVHRHPANSSETDGLRLAVVAEVTADGRATDVVLCDERVVWVDHSLLLGDPLPRTGDRFRIPDGSSGQPGPKRSGNRLVLVPRNDKHPDGVQPGSVVRAGPMSVALDDSWVLLVTDTNARPHDKPVFFAAGRIGAGGRRAKVDEDGAWAKYQRTVAGADDLRKANLPDGDEPRFESRPPDFAEVCWPPDGGQPVARRLKARTYLHKGQPVWVRVDDVTVTEIRLSQLWRYEGSGTAGERAGDAVPCTDPERLCWSCRVFGSADVSGRDDSEVSAQRSYRGHVRIDDLVPTDAFSPVKWRLAPLPAPRPGAGQFYLDHIGVPQSRRVAAKDTKPAATWGSIADEGGLRQIRGRKFYWRTRAPAGGQRGRRREHQSDALSRDVLLIPAGTVFRGRVCFDNLSLPDYGSLVVALDPRTMLLAGQDRWDETVISVGGGRPFGFGAVNIDVTAAKVQTAQGRYLSRDQTAPGIAEAVQAFRAEIPQRVSATWTALRHALTFGFVGDDLVWYPPGAGERGDPEYDQSFGFFARSTGLTLSGKVRDLVVLPPADAPASSQVLDSAPRERPLPDQHRDRPDRNGRRRS